MEVGAGKQGQRSKTVPRLAFTHEFQADTSFHPPSEARRDETRLSLSHAPLTAQFLPSEIKFLHAITVIVSSAIPRMLQFPRFGCPGCLCGLWSEPPFLNGRLREPICRKGETVDAGEDRKDGGSECFS